MTVSSHMPFFFSASVKLPRASDQAIQRLDQRDCRAKQNRLFSLVTLTIREIDHGMVDAAVLGHLVVIGDAELVEELRRHLQRLVHNAAGARPGSESGQAKGLRAGKQRAAGCVSHCGAQKRKYGSDGL